MNFKYAIRLVVLCGMLPGVAWAAAPDGKAIFMHGNANGALPCAACHGIDATGNSATGAPRLAGLAPEVISGALKDFAQGEGGDANMQFIAQALSPAETAAVAQYLSSLPK
jgi:cytochrome c553